MISNHITFLIALLLISTEEPNSKELYFPPISEETWETVSLSKLNWNTKEIPTLEKFLEENSSKVFIILKNGKIAFEWYADDFNKNKNWYWASAGKTLTATSIGIAQQQGFLKIDESSSKYLGTGWTRGKSEKEKLICIKNQLTMTTGLKTTFFSCTKPVCLSILEKPGIRWSYHNGPYTLLQSVVEEASDEPFEKYFNKNLRDKIGMNGFWNSKGNNNFYVSTGRSIARFGLLILNQGTWNKKEILNANFVSKMTTPSQNINKSYGYLWWLNGQRNYMLPSSQKVYSGNLIPNAPKDLIAGLGKNGQKLYVIPNTKMVVIRMGEAANKRGNSKRLFDNNLWERINAVIEN